MNNAFDFVADNWCTIIKAESLDRFSIRILYFHPNAARRGGIEVNHQDLPSKNQGLSQ